MITLLIELCIVGFFINLLYELLHSPLYQTCLDAPLQRYIFLILKGALFDGFVIALFYKIVIELFGNIDIFGDSLELLSFIAITVAFAWFWEVYSLRKRKWQYASHMPKLWGVGVTPLVQLAATGVISLYITLYFLV